MTEPKSFFSPQNIIIIIMILSYILIFFAYRHDINQCNSIIEDRETILQEYCNYSTSQLKLIISNEINSIENNSINNGNQN